MKSRLVELRNKLNLTQTEFGEKIGLTRNAIAAYERGIANPTGTAIIAIVKVFHVNRTWLETGDGDMFEPTTKADETARMIESVSNSPAMRSLLATWAQLSDENKAAFEAFAADYVEDYNRRRTEHALSVDQAIVDDAAASIQQQSTPYADQQAQ